jgi:hypothetical protein
VKLNGSRFALLINSGKSTLNKGCNQVGRYTIVVILTGERMCLFDIKSMNNIYFMLFLIIFRTERMKFLKLIQKVLQK